MLDTPGYSTRGAEKGDQVVRAKKHHSGFNSDLLDEDFFSTFERKFGPVDIDDGPYRCDIVTCMRMSGFRTQDALKRHKRLYH